MIRTLSLQNRQRVRRVDTRLLRRLTLHVLEHELKVQSFELAIHLVGAKEMARVNWGFLQHEGSTDVITFDHATPEFQVVEPKTPNSKPQTRLHGELFVCVDDAVKQAREFRTTWQSELARYVIHGLLHLCGHDDLSPAPRRIMKREENRLVKLIAEEFPIAQLGTQNTKPGTRSSPTRKRVSKN